MKKCHRSSSSSSGVLSPPMSRLGHSVGSSKTPIRNEEDINLLNSSKPVHQNDVVPERNFTTPSPSNEILERDNSIRLQGLVTSLQDEKSKSENEICELKRKLEDLQFQLEEQRLISDEMTSPTPTEEIKTKDDSINKTDNSKHLQEILTLKNLT